VRRLLPVPAVPGPELSKALLQALDGTGPAVLPVSPDPAEAARVIAALRPEEPLEDDEVCLVVPTSGSTGAPKGVLLTAACLQASGDAAIARLGGPGQWHLAIPVTHIGGLQVLLRSLAVGEQPATSYARLGTGRRYVSLVPTQLRRLLVSAPEELASYAAILLGGAAAPPALLADARARGVNVITTYGMSETSGGCVYDGVPLDGVTVEAGERIVLSGAVVARGYRLRPDLTAAAFDGDRFLTSDVGTRQDGVLTVLGRADDLIVTGGEKVAPAAVEAALSEHPAVADVAVVGVADPEWGAVVSAFVVLRPASTLPLDQARSWVAERVSRVAAPRTLTVLDALPLLPGGKVDRAALTTS
jgi:O-succinylbenzoic acid--CoA ligase